MIGYRDMTFCTASQDGRCANEKCDRFFDDDEAQAARRWWGGDDYPVAFGDFAEGCDQLTDPHLDRQS